MRRSTVRSCVAAPFISLIRLAFSNLSSPARMLSQKVCHAHVTTTERQQMATIRKRGSKWQAQVRREGFPAHSKTFTSKADAIRWGREQDRRADTGDFRTPSAASLASLLQRYERDITPLKRSADREHYLIRQIARHRIASLPVSKLSPVAISEFRDDRLKTVGGGTVCKELALLSNVLKIAANEWGFVGIGELVRQVRKPPVGRPRKRRIEPFA
jgi:hypothetical protein